MRISGQNILEFNEGKSLLENARRQRTNATACSGQWERTGLGGISDVEIGYQVRGMRKFRCGDPFRFVSSVFIP